MRARFAGTKSSHLLVVPLSVSCVKVTSNTLSRSILLIFLCCLTVNAAAPQTSSGSSGKLVGIVADPNCVYVPGASIIITGKRLERELSSGKDGSYFVDLPPGRYLIRFLHFGFVTIRKRVQITGQVVTKLSVCFRLDPKHTTTVY
jgi:hypothetical protein